MRFLLLLAMFALTLKLFENAERRKKLNRFFSTLKPLLELINTFLEILKYLFKPKGDSHKNNSNLKPADVFIMYVLVPFLYII